MADALSGTSALQRSFLSPVWLDPFRSQPCLGLERHVVWDCESQFKRKSELLFGVILQGVYISAEVSLSDQQE